jgi:lysozyme
MKTSPTGVLFIKHFEAFRSVRYECAGGKWTIGWGHTKGVTAATKPITLAEGDALLAEDLVEFEDAVNSLVRVPLYQCQFDALVSFAFNVGQDIDEDSIPEGLGDSTLLRKLNAGDYVGAADEFPKWNKAKGKVLPGLVKRRAAERAMFFGIRVVL